MSNLVKKETADIYYKRFLLWHQAAEFKFLYKTGARIWIPHPDLVWEGAEVVEDYAAKILKVKTEDGKIKTIGVETEENLPHLRNPDILIGENDLTSLSYLHEPAVLYNLQVRFCNQNAIYTYCGIVLVAINPYTELPIYGPDTIHAYRGQAMGDLDPHIFAVAEEAYTKMEREQRDQSIIVSGESGAGKTVSAKYAMRYFATVGGSTTETHVEKKVLASSPIMEAIGNAKTTRNDNSSRFGKFIELQFSRSYNIIGASMRTYLLEKSRVVFQAPEERNYHILYQLCAGRQHYPDLLLGDARTYRYLNEEAEIPGVDDAQCFQETVSALITLGFSERKISDIFKVLASILHLGNINISGASDMDDSSIAASDAHLRAFSQLLGVDTEQFRKWLCLRRIASIKETFEKPMTLLEASGARDALAKYIYAELFSWIVEVINRSLETSSGARHKFIGVLDIYGFETFEINSFEQFCINYANEKLQQQFNQHVFKLEQEEYLKEDIEWKFIDFCDNQPCIDLIETKLGILDLLDEECRMPKGTDNSWVEKLYGTCTKWPHFTKPRFGNSAFVIKHFADKVEYEATGFLEKNRDTVIEEQVEALRGGDNRLVRHLFRDENRLAPPTNTTTPIPKPRAILTTQKSVTSAPSKNKKTVGSQFRSSLSALMSTLNATTPHYIRCIKPNDSKQPFEFNSTRAVQQLRACGVLETIRISAAGFPSRWPYMDFFNRYRVLCRSRDIKRDNMRATCECILVNFIKDSDKFKFGKTKIFFRAGQVAYLERLRSERLKHCCIVMQKTVRGFLQRSRYTRVTRAVRTLQRVTRGFIARRRVKEIRRNHAAVQIQRYMRGWIKRAQYLQMRRLALGLQARARGLLARRRFLERKYNHAALIIQKNLRAWICRKRYKESTRKLIVAQNAVRRFLARRKLKELKKEARTVQHHITLNKGLENKIIQLQQQIGELTKENNALKLVNNELVETRAKLEALRGADVELKKRTSELNEKDKKLQQILSELEQERNEKVDLITEKETLLNEYNSEKTRFNNDIAMLKEQVDQLNEQIKSTQTNAEEQMKYRLNSEKQQLLLEHDKDLDNYQKVLCEKNDLEARCDMLEREIIKLKGGKVTNLHNRTLSDSSGLSQMEDSMMTLMNEIPDEDFGYGSVRSASSRSSDWSSQTTPESTINRSKLTAVTATSHTHDSQAQAQPVDVALVLKLQQKLKAVESERDRLHRRLEDKDDGPAEQKAQDNFKLQELEMENSKLRTDLMSLRKTVADNIPGKSSEELINQFKTQEAELVRLRDECVQLRGVLANQTQGLRSIATSNYAAQDMDMSLINEDGELVLAFEAQKKINRQLEDELQTCQMRWNVEREELVEELKRLRQDNERQQKLLSANLTKSPQSQNEAFLQHEIARLTNDNLELQDKYDHIADEYRRAKKMYKDLHKRMKDAGVSDLVGTQVPAVVEPAAYSKPIVRKKERIYNGMFEFKKGDESVIIRHLLWELKPQTAVTLLPGLPAYILFMCVRHTDFINDEEKVRNLLAGFINTVKKVVKKRQDDIETTVMWLSNTLRILHNLKQYSGEKTFKEDNTATQNEQCLRNFDLSEYRQVLSDLAIWIYMAVIRYMEEKLQHKAVPAILEHEAISGLSAGKRGRTASVSDATTVPAQQALESLLQELTGFHRTLILHGIDQEIIIQVFRQLFYYICASSLNNLLLRRDLCHWGKGMNIRYNLSHIEQWARDQKLNDPLILDMLAPIIQAAQLLQARKYDEDVNNVCEMCNKMSVPQIIKLLNLYTPADDFEERVPLSFIRKVQQRLKERADVHDQSTLLMDTKFNFPVRFPFKPSPIQLEEIEIPEVLNLPMLKKV